MKNIKKQIQEKIGEDMEREQYAIAAAEALRDLIAEKWVGKKVNKRLCDQFKAKLAPEPAMQEKMVAWLNYIGGMCNLETWGFGPYSTSGKRLCLFLGYNESNFRGNGEDDKSRSFNLLTVAGFEENNVCHLRAAKERQEARKTLLENGTLDKISEAVENIAAAKDRLKNLTEFGKPGHEVVYFAERLAGIRDN